MEISYGIMCRRKRQKKPPFNLPPFLWRAPVGELESSLLHAGCIWSRLEMTRQRVVSSTVIMRETASRATSPITKRPTFRNCLKA